MDLLFGSPQMSGYIICRNPRLGCPRPSAPSALNPVAQRGLGTGAGRLPNKAQYGLLGRIGVHLAKKGALIYIKNSRALVGRTPRRWTLPPLQKQPTCCSRPHVFNEATDAGRRARRPARQEPPTVEVACGGLSVSQ